MFGRIATVASIVLFGLPAIATPIESRGYLVSESAIADTRRLLRSASPTYADISAERIAHSHGFYCETRSMGWTDEMYAKSYRKVAFELPDPQAMRLAMYFASVSIIAKETTCPEFADR